MVYYTIVRRDGNDRRAKDAARTAALRRLLPLLGVPLDAAVARDENGRLYLPAYPHVDINVSHADPLTAVVAGTTRVGVDVEREDKLRDPEALARRFFTEREIQAVTSSPDPREAALTVWTRKEAMGKYIGTGLAKTLADCTFTPPDGTAFYTKILTENGCRYALTVCADQPPTSVDG